MIRSNLWGMAAVIAAAVAAGGCAVHQVNEYDPMLDAALSDYYRGADRFIAQMAVATLDRQEIEAKNALMAANTAAVLLSSRPNSKVPRPRPRPAPKPKPLKLPTRGLFENNRQYYIEADAQISTMLLRAQAANPFGECRGAANERTEAFLTKILVVDHSIPEVARLQQTLAMRPPGDCVVQVLYGLKINNDYMAALHRHHKVLGPIEGGLVKDNIYHGVFLAQAEQLAKKRTGTTYITDP